MDLPHEEFEHERSREYVGNALAILEAGIAGGIVYNARYTDAKFYAGRAYWQERSNIRDENRPQHDAPNYRKWWALMDALPYELTHLQTVDRKLAAAIKQHGIDLKDPLLEATHARILRFKERWEPLHRMIREAKPLVVKGREPPSEPRDAPARTIENTGSCCVCEKNVKLDDGKAVDHGFQVSDGRQGSCFGVGRPPIEISPQGAIEYIQHLEQRQAATIKHLAHLESPDIERVADFSTWPPKTYEKADKGFAVALRSAISRTKSEIGTLESWLTLYRRKVETWKPRPLPDGNRDHMPPAANAANGAEVSTPGGM